MLRGFSVLLYVFLSASVHAEPLPEQDIPALLQARVKETQGTAIVAGIIDAQGRRFYSYGPADTVSGKPVDEHTLFEIGSVTKLFTSLLLADMAVKGEVSLDDPVQLHLPPGVKAPQFREQPIRLLDLSLHRSGLPLDLSQSPLSPAEIIAQGYDIQSLYRFVSAYTLNRAPGTTEYSNVGVSLLGFALASRAGHSYEQLIRDRITGPIGMRDTGITVTPAMRARLAQGYRGNTAQPSFSGIPAYAPAGGLYSTASDMLNFLGAAFSLTPSPLDAVTAYMRKPYSEKPDVRLGWGMGRRYGSEFWTHAGRTFGYASMVVFDATGGRGVVLLANSTTELSDLAYRILNTKFRLRQFVVPPAFVRMVEESDFGQVMATYRALKHRDPEFFLEESTINEWGGVLLSKGRTHQAVALLAFNCQQFPKSANTFDSLGEAYEASGDRTQAIAAYRKALELDPNFSNAADRLRVLAPPESHGGAK